MSLVSQKRLAAELLKVGTTRVWVDPDDTDRVASAITRVEIRKLIHEGSIAKLPKTGISRGRKRTRRQELLAGRHKGPGHRKAEQNRVNQNGLSESVQYDANYEDYATNAS